MSGKLLIGVITTECFSEYQSETMRGIISQAFKSSCDLVVLSSLQNFFFTNTHRDTEKNIFELILSDNFDGFIYDRNVFYDTDIQKYIDVLCTKSGKPVMVLDYAGHTKFETTLVDDIDAFESITDHLIDVHGYKKIYCLTGPKSIACSEERLKGYLRSMKKHKLPIDKSYYFYGDFWTSASSELVQKIVNGTIDKPDAVVCGNDKSAVALIEKLTNAGLRVPEDIAVTGYDATMEGYYSNVSVTSYARPHFQLGAESFRRLYRIITGRLCNKVPNEPGELRPAKSCGCAENPVLKREIQRRIKKSDLLQTKMLFSDMLVDVTNIDSYADVFNRVDHYTYLLYKMSRIHVCLTDKYIHAAETNPLEKLSFSCSDSVTAVYRKSSIQRTFVDYEKYSMPDFIDYIRKERSQPSAFYMVPLHYNDSFFGFAAITFGKHPITYDKLFIQWINNLNIALDKVLLKASIRLTKENLSALSAYDSETGILSRSGLASAYKNAAAARKSRASSLCCMYIELTDLKKIYYQAGYRKAEAVVKRFSDVIKDCTSQNELCGTLSPEAFCIISFEKSREEQLFADIRHRLGSSAMFAHDHDDIAFTMGVHTASLSNDIPEFAELIHKAAVNKIHTHTKSENSVNPNFEKLCILRSDMSRNPQLSWNISEIADTMFISKSYLQKIYKSAFGKSIIEELIEFRINKAKELLITTNKTVSDIASECGYSTYNYFVRQFRTSESVSPSEYRELNKNQ